MARMIKICQLVTPNLLWKPIFADTKSKLYINSKKLVNSRAAQTAILDEYESVQERRLAATCPTHGFNVAARRRSCDAHTTRHYLIAAVGKTLIIVLNRNCRELLLRIRARTSYDDLIFHAVTLTCFFGFAGLLYFIWI